MPTRPMWPTRCRSPSGSWWCCSPAWILARITRVFTRRLVKHMSGGVEKLASMKAVSFVDTGPMPQARRTQRAETVGAVVRSIVTIAIWSVAVLTVLEILGVNLGPLIAARGSRVSRSASARSRW